MDNPNLDLSQLSDFERNLIVQARAMQAAANPQGTPAPTTTAVGSPVTLKIGGKDMTFNSQKDLEDAMNAVLVESNKQVEQAQGIALAASNRQAPVVTPNAPPDKDALKAQFFAEMDADPDAAMTKWLNTKVFGNADGGNAIELLKQSAIITEQNRQLTAVNQFRAQNPDFNPQFGPALDQVRQSLGLGIDPQGLDAAYQYAKARGVIPVNTAPPAPQVPLNGYGQPVVQAAPMPGRFGTPQNYNEPALDPYVANTLESLSTTQLEQLMQSQGMGVR